MSDFNIEIKFDGDSEGYITNECPFCESQFKLKIDEMQHDDYNVDELFCPYCGLKDERNHFFTKEQVKHIEKIAENQAVEMINREFSKMTKSFNNNGVIKMDFKPLQKENVPALAETDGQEQEFICGNCQRHSRILYNAGASKAFCAYCGVDL